jgi:P27 family predicted phage terminase small subunit
MRKPTLPGPPKAPKKLSKEAREIWNRVMAQWALDQAGLIVLAQALESLDRMRQAQSVLAEQGIVAVDRFGQSKPHPAFLVERDSRSSMLRAFKQLNLEVAAPAK